MTHSEAENIVQQTDNERDNNRNKDNNERMRHSGMIRRPDDMREFFANVLKISKGCVHKRICSGQIKKPYGLSMVAL